MRKLLWVVPLAFLFQPVLPTLKLNTQNSYLLLVPSTTEALAGQTRKYVRHRYSRQRYLRSRVRSKVVRAPSKAVSQPEKVRVKVEYRDRIIYVPAFIPSEPSKYGSLSTPINCPSDSLTDWATYQRSISQ